METQSHDVKVRLAKGGAFDVYLQNLTAAAAVLGFRLAVGLVLAALVLGLLS